MMAPPPGPITIEIANENEYAAEYFPLLCSVARLMKMLFTKGNASISPIVISITVTKALHKKGNTGRMKKNNPRQ